MKKRLIWTIAAAAVLFAGAVVYGLASAGASVELYKVTKGEIAQYLEETAVVKSTDRYAVYIEGAGMVTGIYADVGQTVKQGDLLLTLDKTDLELQLKNAEAVIAASRAQLESTDLINYANKIDQARIAENQAKISYDSARRSFENAKKLYESQTMSKEEFEKTQDVYKAALAALDAASLQLADIRRGAPGYLKNSYLAQLEQAEINRDGIVNRIEKQEVRSPADGTVVEKLVDKGSPAVLQTAAFIIEDVSKLEIEADVLSDDINKIRVGNDVDISGRTLGGGILDGKVKKIAPAAKSKISSLGVSQNRVPVTIEIAGETNLLKPGFSVDVKILTAAGKDILKVPDTAVFDYEGNSTVFVAKNGKARLRTVKKGIESDDFIEIRQGLKEGDLVIAKPDNSLKEGRRVNAK